MLDEKQYIYPEKVDLTLSKKICGCDKNVSIVKVKRPLTYFY